MQKEQEFFSSLIAEIKEKKPSKQALNLIKNELCKRFKIRCIPTDIEILMHCPEKDFAILKKYLTTKPTRTGSGVAVVAVMTKPFPCPHGKCAYCPGGIDSEFGSVPQSYTGNEPATMRAIRHGYDTYSIIFNRLEQYIVMGQSCQKIELIAMGGTFLSFPKKYKENFIFMCFRALNDFSGLFFDKKGNLLVEKFRKFFELPGEVGSPERAANIRKKIERLKSRISARGFVQAIRAEQKKNETSFARCVGLTIETRPDFGLLKHGNELLGYGCTRVELGVQSVYEDALKRVERGHSVQDSIHSTRILKDLGFKINYHVMPGLPGVSCKKDLAGLNKLFSSPDFRPDMLKIYPCMVMPGTKLAADFRNGKFAPLSTEKAASLIAEFKKTIPRYVRIMRVQRDIPSNVVLAGVDRTNLRQYVEDSGVKCSCIRCREIGNSGIAGKPGLDVIEYGASNGSEFFISLVDENDRLLGFCRLRFPSEFLRKEISGKSALIRELHVYGSALALGLTEQGKTQHRGFGAMLLQKAELIAKQHSREKIVVISGVGVRDYYRKHGYRKEGPYMVKHL
ncbi:MAG: tRNA uridine(34) 5-carboxymethylaminomethyl modification radical SAM/GNAT enzyme Elp3 [Candidatus Woesearchaeota archaeon]